MAQDLFISQALSTSTIRSLAKATRSYCDISDDENFDIIKFLEVDVLRLIPDFYLFIEDDSHMGGSKAFVTEDSKGIVVAESVYNDAAGGLFYARKILAHEFGHVLLHHNKDFETKHFTFNGYKKQFQKMELFHSSEWQADTFAIVLLISPSLIDANTTADDFGRQNQMSRKQSEFVLNRLKNFRKRENRPDIGLVNKIIESRLHKKAHKVQDEPQFSFFFNHNLK